MDILITTDIKTVKTEKISVGGLKIPVITLEELLKMKLKSGRPQDLLDVEMIHQRLKDKKHEKK